MRDRLNAGGLRHRVTIQTPTHAQDTQGGLTESWANGNTVWASIETLYGRELMYARQSESQATCLIRMRYDATITERHRLLFGTRTFGIESINNVDERNAEMVLSCRELR